MRIEKTKHIPYDFGHIMINVEFPQLTEIHSQIKTGDVYFGDDIEQFGLEDEPHVTLLYGIKRGVGIDDIVPYIDKIDLEYIKTLKTSIFNSSKEYDVLKLDVEDSGLSLHNEILKNKLPNIPSNFTYNPHLTLAYLNVGLGEIYVQKIGDIKLDLKISYISFTTPEGDKYKIYK